MIGIYNWIVRRWNARFCTKAIRKSSWSFVLFPGQLWFRKIFFRFFSRNWSFIGSLYAAIWILYSLALLLSSRSHLMALFGLCNEYFCIIRRWPEIITIIIPLIPGGLDYTTGQMLFTWYFHNNFSVELFPLCASCLLRSSTNSNGWERYRNIRIDLLYLLFDVINRFVVYCGQSLVASRIDRFTRPGNFTIFTVEEKCAAIMMFWFPPISFCSSLAFSRDGWSLDSARITRANII